MDTSHELDSGLTEEPGDTSVDWKQSRRRRSVPKLYVCVVLSLGLLCVLQGCVNIALRLYSENPWAAGREHLINTLGDLTRLGWLYFNHSLYFISTTKRSWTAGRDYCLQRDADLVIINSQEEQEFVVRVGDDPWIGLSDRDSEGTWQWVDGTNMTLSFWLSGEPNDNGGAEDCVAVLDSTWNDEPCDLLKSWICEKAIVLEHLEAELNKEVMQKEEEEAPLIKEPPSIKMVSVNDTALFPCSASGRPQPTVWWLHDGRPVRNDRTNNQSERAVWLEDGSLVFRAVRPGVHSFSCLANNSAGTANQTFKLFVIGLTPDGWMLFNYGLYFISTIKKSWTASRDYCLQRDADLVIINSREKQEFVTRLGSSYWIGLRLARDSEGTWQWVDGTNMTSSYWLSGEPNDYHGAEECVVTWNTGWYDESCAGIYSWICEKAIALEHLEAEQNKEGL